MALVNRLCHSAVTDHVTFLLHGSGESAHSFALHRGHLGVGPEAVEQRSTPQPCSCSAPLSGSPRAPPPPQVPGKQGRS